MFVERILDKPSFVNGVLHKAGDVVRVWEEPERPVEKHRIEWSVGLATNTYTSAMLAKRGTAKSRLLNGDPDWHEFKRRWAEEHGPIGDEE